MQGQEETGLVICRARQYKRMSQSDLAAALGVTRTTVSDWETGRHFPARNAGDIERLLGIRLCPDGCQRRDHRHLTAPVEAA